MLVHAGWVEGLIPEQLVSCNSTLVKVRLPLFLRWMLVWLNGPQTERRDPKGCSNLRPCRSEPEGAGAPGPNRKGHEWVRRYLAL